MPSFNFVQVKHTGARTQPMRVKIIVDGKNYSPGYVFGKGVTQAVYECEADVLTGKTKPEIDNETGAVKNGFIVIGDLGDLGLTGEAYEVVQPEEPGSQDQEPAKPKARKAEPALVQ